MPRAALVVVLALSSCADARPVVPTVEPRPAPPLADASAPDAAARAPSAPPHVVAVAGKTSCIVRGGRVYCFGDRVNAPPWGHNADASPTPKPIAGIDDAVAIALASGHACALRGGGGAVCWGEVDDGKSGHTDYDLRPHYVERTIDTPEAVAGLSDGVEIAIAPGYACARRATGAVACWGRNWKGVLGDASSPGHLEARDVPGIDDAIAIACDEAYACAARRNGEVVCWGDGNPPHAIDGLAPAARVAVGDERVCAVRTTGEVVCVSASPQRGAPTRTEPSVSKLDAVSVAIAQGYRCLVRPDATLACSGRADSRPPEDLGGGTVGSAALRDVAVDALKDVVDVAVSRDHACAIDRRGALSCWGANDAGQSGQPFAVTVASPARVDGIADASHVAMAANSACATKRDGSVACWGSTGGAALGGGATSMDDASPSPSPAVVDGVSDATEIAGDDSHYCVVRKDATVVCWGQGGPLDDCRGSQMQCTPEPIGGLSDVIDVGAAIGASCAVKRNGTVACWGNPLGAGSHPAWRGNGVAKLDGLSNVARLAMSRMDGCAIRRNGTVACFGQTVSVEYEFRPKSKGYLAEMKGARDVAWADGGLALLKNGELREVSSWIVHDPKRASPPAIGAPGPRAIATDVVKVATHGGGACALRRSGEVLCLDAHRVAKPVGIADAVDVAASAQGAFCVVRKSGEVACWGENASGECGVDPNVVVGKPTSVAGLPPAK